MLLHGHDPVGARSGRAELHGKGVERENRDGVVGQRATRDLQPVSAEPGTDLALVMGGGGARGAYQVGVLRSIARHYPDLSIPIQTGVSAGAINSVFLGNCTQNFGGSVEALTDLWSRLTTDQVFRTDTLALVRTACRWGIKIVSGGRNLAPAPRGMVDTAPLRKFLTRAFAGPDGVLSGIRDNLRCSRLKALAITTTDYSTGLAVTHVQSNGAPMWTRPQRVSVESLLTIEHVLASASLPLFFPAVKIGDSWHGDGGIRLTAPLSPALHLGAGRILAISTRYEPRPGEAVQHAKLAYPPAAQVIGLMLSAVFLDMLDYDVLNMDRINQLVAALPEENRMGLRTAGLLLLRPSRNLAELASEYEGKLPQPFRFFLRGSGTREVKSPESLSMVMFEPTFIRHAIELGEEDGEARKDEIAAFLAGDTVPGMQATGCWRVG
jgi:NTE family protein